MKTENRNSYKVFHSSCGYLRKRVHIVLVHPEEPGNVGSVARATANMGIETPLRIVGTPEIITDQAHRLAKHAGDRLTGAQFYPSLESALTMEAQSPTLAIAATARIGSPNRPHPLWIRDAIPRAMGRLKEESNLELFLVFGRESDGLTNEEVALCQWIVTIPSSDTYRSLNLAQSVLIFCHEINQFLLAAPEEFRSAKTSQKERLVAHLLQMAEDVGFILPGDPFKMRPRLESLFSGLPKHVKDVKTLHGLIDQIVRSVRKSGVDYKGRYRKRVDSDNPVQVRS